MASLAGFLVCTSRCVLLVGMDPKDTYAVGWFCFVFSSFGNRPKIFGITVGRKRRTIFNRATLFGRDTDIVITSSQNHPHHNHNHHNNSNHRPRWEVRNQNASFGQFLFWPIFVPPTTHPPPTPPNLTTPVVARRGPKGGGPQGGGPKVKGPEISRFFFRGPEQGSGTGGPGPGSGGGGSGWHIPDMTHPPTRRKLAG